MYSWNTAAEQLDKSPASRADIVRLVTPVITSSAAAFNYALSAQRKERGSWPAALQGHGSLTRWVIRNTGPQLPALPTACRGGVLSGRKER